ncbi:uncharacterized protein N7473_009980 [Penicillium subrubescens]|uniref:uncharacterized protein n=1 Tax=Penicillium subrubescens TaxID=1316194 RepID=UPI00254562B4|nr:uncharacterized protein N7473_009980 [Penicillium subrubescens]KAJ5883094.1 hypothetical protein N7473_009980 [Penicillium subrubescens]
MAKFEDFIDPSRLSWSKAVVAVVEKELGSEMGTVYRKAVQFCLFENKEIGREDQARQDMGQLEPGIEKGFFWIVVDELGRIPE